MALAAHRLEQEASAAPPGAATRQCPSPAEVLELVAERICKADGATREPGQRWTDRAKVGDYKARIGKGLPYGRVSAQANIARAIGVHPVTLGRYLNGTSKPSPKFAAQAWSWLGIMDARLLDGEASHSAAPAVAQAADSGPLADTAALRRIAKLCRYCMVESVMGMLISETSCGKTTGLLAFARSNPSAIYVKASVVRTATKRGFMDAVWSASGRRSQGARKQTQEQRWDALVSYLRGDGHTSTRIILVDDAHVLSYGVLECLRDLHDEAGVGIVLAGTTRLSSRVSLAGDAHQMYEQLRARVQIVHKLGKPCPSDVEAVARAWVPEGRELDFTREAMDWLARSAVGLGALRVVKAHVRMALHLSGELKVNGLLGMEHLAAAHQQLDAGVLA